MGEQWENSGGTTVENSLLSADREENFFFETKFLDLSIFESKEGYNDQAQQNWQEESGSLFSW